MDLTKLRKIKILSLLGLKDEGRDVSINCPFHHDQTPSMRIYKDNSYHCFGCGVNGRGAIDFLKESGEGFITVINELEKYV